MRTVVLASSFKRAFKRLVRRQPELEERIEERLALLTADRFEPLLQTHKLKGNLSGAWACSVDYDCRINSAIASTIFPELQLTTEQVLKAGGSNADDAIS
ncbi:type II toxin-antitoxin system YafQ family toxin [Nostoc commune]|uniref:type II toxin-antitoxin system RelE/ParE family toxin n=1 Tax=Nostoc commune TaxID=1178 RepID=UPI0018C78502|nr:type II toxin-antitoxin system mRNA interferase toxin, RelE/StbE family [Nostoc commune]MBG1264412.1 type II toxin-antitoxin system mRNA interferase toxin, RelE/StbE family [Nostoc commune BAE]